MTEQVYAPQTPSVGRDVHYVAFGTPGGEFPAGVCRAAKITVLQPGPLLGEGLDVVKLCIFNPTGLFFSDWLRQDEETKAPGTWHWPERV